jgi:hypothetical protein
LDAVIKQGEEVVWYDAFYGFAIAITKADPESVELGSTEEGLALGFKVVGELTNKINRTNSVEGKLLVLAVWCEEVDGIGLAKPGGIQIAAERLLVGEDNDDLLVSRGWGAVFQRNQFAKDRKKPKFAINQDVCYVKRVFPVNLLFSLGLGPGAPAVDR